MGVRTGGRGGKTFLLERHHEGGVLKGIENTEEERAGLEGQLISSNQVQGRGPFVRGG